MKRIFAVAKTVLVWLITALAVFMTAFTIISTRTFDQSTRTIFGYKAFIVMSDSMAATDFDAGDLILTKYVDPSTLEVGDIISFVSYDPDSYGEVISHKIREITVNEKGESGFVTYGTTTDTDDRWIVTHDYILGKHQLTLPKVGHFFHFLKTPQGYISFILIPFLILITAHAIQCVRLFRQHKREQEAVLEAERQNLAAQRAELEELRALKAQLAASVPSADTPPAQEV